MGHRRGQKLSRPVQPAMAQPCRREALAPLPGHDRIDRQLIGLGRGGGKGERHLAKAQLEQAIAASRLAVVIPLGCGAGEDLDLAGVEPEAFVNPRDLRFACALVGEKKPCRAAFDDRGRDRGRRGPG